MASVSSSTASNSLGGASEVRSGGPIVFMLASGLVWLLFGLLIALIASVKLQNPTLLSDFSFLTYGRLHAASGCALVYGFAAQVGLGLSLWLLVRLGDVPIPVGGFAGIAAAFWNAGLTFGIPGILAGQGTGIRWLELPSEVTPLLFLAYLTLATLGILVFYKRGSFRISTPQGYLFASLFWFPWIFSTAEIALVFSPVRGVLQGIVAGWYSQALFNGWFTLMALGILYSLIPELTGRTLRHPVYAGLGFWTWLLLSGWTGGAALVGGPVPAWIPTVAVASGVLMVIPTVLISLNLHLGGRLSLLFSSPALMLAVASSLAFTVGGLLTGVTSLRCAKEILQYTQFLVGLQQLQLLGFVGLALLAGIYVAFPRLTGQRLPFAFLSFVHVAGSLAGLVIAVGALLVGGWGQGFELNDRVDPVIIVRHLRPWLALNTLGLAIFLGSQLALVANLLAAAVRGVLPWWKPVLAWILTPTPTSTSSAPLVVE